MGFYFDIHFLRVFFLIVFHFFLREVNAERDVHFFLYVWGRCLWFTRCSNWAEAEIPFNKALSCTPRGWTGAVFAYKPAPSLCPYTQPNPTPVSEEKPIVSLCLQFPVTDSRHNTHWSAHSSKWGAMAWGHPCSCPGTAPGELPLGGLCTGWAVKTAGVPELSPPDVTREWHTKPPQHQIHTADLQIPLRSSTCREKGGNEGLGNDPSPLQHCSL